jgi:hypothetical protein
MAFRVLPIARPCPESFEGMPGDDRRRFCARCNKHVHDLASHTEEEARALFARSAGARPCVRVTRDAHGRVLFRAAGLAAAVSLAACAAAPPPTPSAATGAATAPSEPAYEREMGDGIPDSEDRCPDPPAPRPSDCPPVEGETGKDRPAKPIESH